MGLAVRHSTGNSVPHFSGTNYNVAKQMHLYKALKELYAQKQKLERVIASLEELRLSGSAAIPTPPSGAKRRGRKMMGLEERQEVSKRMKKYWASRRKRRPEASKRR